MLNVSMEQGNALYRSIVKSKFGLPREASSERGTRGTTDRTDGRERMSAWRNGHGGLEFGGSAKTRSSPWSPSSWSRCHHLAPDDRSRPARRR